MQRMVNYVCFIVYICVGLELLQFTLGAMMLMKYNKRKQAFIDYTNMKVSVMLVMVSLPMIKLRIYSKYYKALVKESKMYTDIFLNNIKNKNYV